MTASVNPWLVAAARFVIGYACSGLFLVTESWINDRADSSTRGRMFGVYLVVNWGATAAGPLLLPMRGSGRYSGPVSEELAL